MFVDKLRGEIQALEVVERHYQIFTGAGVYAHPW